MADRRRQVALVSGGTSRRDQRAVTITAVIKSVKKAHPVGRAARARTGDVLSAFGSGRGPADHANPRDGATATLPGGGRTHRCERLRRRSPCLASLALR